MEQEREEGVKCEIAPGQYNNMIFELEKEIKDLEDQYQGNLQAIKDIDKEGNVLDMEIAHLTTEIDSLSKRRERVSGEIQSMETADKNSQYTMTALSAHLKTIEAQIAKKQAESSAEETVLRGKMDVYRAAWAAQEQFVIDLCPSGRDYLAKQKERKLYDEKLAIVKQQERALKLIFESIGDHPEEYENKTVNDVVLEIANLFNDIQLVRSAKLTEEAEKKAQEDAVEREKKEKFAAELEKIRCVEQKVPDSNDVIQEEEAAFEEIREEEEEQEVHIENEITKSPVKYNSPQFATRPGVVPQTPQFSWQRQQHELLRTPQLVRNPKPPSVSTLPATPYIPMPNIAMFTRPQTSIAVPSKPKQPASMSPTPIGAKRSLMKNNDTENTNDKKQFTVTRGNFGAPMFGSDVAPKTDKTSTNLESTSSAPFGGMFGGQSSEKNNREKATSSKNKKAGFNFLLGGNDDEDDDDKSNDNSGGRLF